MKYSAYGVNSDSGHFEATEPNSAMAVFKSPAERATYVLREGFEYPYRQIAETLRIGVPNARQLVKRARDRLASDGCHTVA